MKTKTVTDTILIQFIKSDEVILDIDVQKETENTYLCEGDGTKVDEFREAFSEIMDRQFDWNSDDKKEAWVENWNEEAINEFDGKRFRVTRHQEWEIDEDGEMLDLVGDEKFEIEEINTIK